MVRGGVRPAEVAALLVRHDIEVHRLARAEATLEEIFLRLTAA